MLKRSKKAVSLLLAVAMILSTMSFAIAADETISADADKDIAIFTEAEDMKFSRSGTFQDVKDKTASNGKFINSNGGSAKLEDPDSQDPEATFKFTADEDATYYVWMRYMAIDQGSDSFFIGFDDMNLNSQYGSAAKVTGEAWSWQMSLSAELKKGSHTLKLYHRESPLRFDAFYISKDPNFVPSEAVPLLEEQKKAEEEAKRIEEEKKKNRVYEFVGDVHKVQVNGIMIEAEACDFEELTIEKGDSKEVSGGKYIELPSPKSRIDDPYVYVPPHASYTFEIDKAGKQIVWARMKALDGGKDTGWACVDNGDFVQIKGDVVDGFVWAKIVDVNLEKGKHTLNIVAREPRLMIDKFIVTSNAGYVPSGLGDTTAKITYESVYPRPSITPPPGHPRVMFTADDIPKIKENMTKPQNAEAYAAYQKLIENTMTKGDLGSSGQFAGKPLEVAEAKALEYALSGNEELGNQAITLMRDFCNSYDYTTGDYNTRGEVIFIIGEVYDWCYPLLSEEDKTLFQNMVPVIASYMEIGWPPTKQGAVTGHGSEAQIMRDLLAAGIAMFDERPDIYDNSAGRIISEYVPAREFMYQMHSHHQGSHYANYRFQWDLLSMKLFDAMGYPNIYGEDLRWVVHNYLYTRRPDGLVMLEGDNSQNNREVGQYDTTYRRSMFLAGNYWGDPYMKYEAARTMNLFKPDTMSSNQALGAVEFLLHNDPDLQPKHFSELPLTFYQPSPKGGYIARTSWDEGVDAPTVVAHMKINEYYFKNHQHLDAGAFTLYYKGNLATDDGYYQGYRTDDNSANNGNTNYGALHFYNYYRRSIAHNTMLVYDPSEGAGWRGGVNDGGQWYPNNNESEVGVIEQILDPESGNKIGEILGHEYGIDQREPNYTYLKGDIANAYSDKVENFERSFMFLNLKNDEHPAAMLVFDRVISADASFKKTWLCHGLFEPTVEGNRTTFVNTKKAKGVDQYNGKLTIDTLLPKNVEHNKVGGEGYEHYVAGTNWLGLPATSTNVNEGQGWRIEISPAEANTQDYFLNVLQVGDADGADPLDVTLIETDTHAGAVVADRVVVFGKDRDRTKNDVTFSFAGDGEYEIMVADLVAGTWTVTKDGTDAGEAVSTEEGGVAVFNGGAGTYTLSYANENAVRQTYSSDAPYNEGIMIKVDGRYIYSDVPPVIQDGRTLVPMRAIFEKLEADVAWDEATATATATRAADGKEVKITENSQTAYIDGNAVELDVPAQILDGRFVVPVRFVSESFGATVNWDQFSQVVSIKPEKIIKPTEMVGYENCATVKDVTGDYSDDFYPTQTVDGDFATIWSAQGEVPITFELDQECEVRAIEVFLNPNSNRSAKFEILYSTDGKNFTSIKEYNSDGQVYEAWETFTFPTPVKAKYIMYLAKGSDKSMWNGVKEVRFPLVK